MSIQDIIDMAAKLDELGVPENARFVVCDTRNPAFQDAVGAGLLQETATYGVYRITL